MGSRPTAVSYTHLFVDSTLKIGGRDMEALLSFVKKLQVLSEKANTNLVLSVSADKSEIPAELAELAL